MNTSKSRLKFKRQGLIGKSFDWLLRPIMYWLQDTWLEEPQGTHFWNNQQFNPKTFSFDKEWLVTAPCDPFATKRRMWGFIPLFHMPRFGGWREYVALEVVDFNAKWHIGWVTTELAGVSLVSVQGAVRVLCGPEKTCFFGVTQTGRQIQLKVLGYGRIGDRGPFSKLPLR